MAKIECIQEQKEDRPESVERIEVRPWGLGGTKYQQFLIGSGANFDATGNVLLEIVYSVNGAQLFYTRDYLHHLRDTDASGLEQRLEQFRRGEVDSFGFGDMLPETFIRLKRERFTYPDENQQEVSSEIYRLEISADVGAVIGHESPGTRMISIQLPYIGLDTGVEFMRALIHEIAGAYQGKHPNPAEFPDGASDWHFVRQLNQKAYDRISQDYEEKYFSNPLLSEMFDSWLAELTPGCHILDAGCGHGNPVIARLLEKGFQVTGTDLSPKMLEKARVAFPNVTFLNQMVSDIRSEAEFDGACSLSSMLYLDPIDLSHSMYRLYRALKPGGLLFLYAYDTHPNWRGLPYDVELDQWMWSWSYSMDEAAQALEEFGYFEVLRIQEVTTEEEKAERAASWRKYKEEEQEKLMEYRKPGLETPLPDFSRVTDKLPYCYAIIARRVVDSPGE